MSANVGNGEFRFDCIVERPRAAPFGGRFAIIVTLLLMLIAIAAIFPAQRADPREAGEPTSVDAA